MVAAAIEVGCRMWGQCVEEQVESIYSVVCMFVHFPMWILYSVITTFVFCLSPLSFHVGVGVSACEAVSRCLSCHFILFQYLFILFQNVSLCVSRFMHLSVVITKHLAISSYFNVVYSTGLFIDDHVFIKIILLYFINCKLFCLDMWLSVSVCVCVAISMCFVISLYSLFCHHYNIYPFGNSVRYPSCLFCILCVCARVHVRA